MSADGWVGARTTFSAIGWKRRRNAAARAKAASSPALTPAQIASLGVLLVAAQLPQAVHLPIWVALFGVRARRAALRAAAPRPRRGRSQRRRAFRHGRSRVFALAIAFAIRKSYGYFVGRDPCVAFLFVLVGIKFLEVRTLRDGTLLVCLAIFLLITPFFYSQSLLAAFAVLPAVLAARRGAGIACVRPRRSLRIRRRGARHGGARRR